MPPLKMPLRFAATKLVEGDALVLESLHFDENEKDAIEHIIAQMEEEGGTDRMAALADMRFRFHRGRVRRHGGQARSEPRA